MRSPLFSVIIPTYNRHEVLLRAVSSVLRQTCSDFEVVIVDDGSTPPVQSVLGTILQAPNVQCLAQPNSGPTVARRLGIAHAKGTYICCLDDDDEFLPNHLAKLEEVLRQPAFDGYLVKTGVIRRTQGEEDFHFTFYDNGKSLLEQHWVQGDSLLSYAIPRALAVGEPPSHLHAEDFNWIGRLMLRTTCWQIPEYTVVYHWHQDNRTASNPDKSVLRDRMVAVKDLYYTPGMRSRVPKALYLRNMAHQGLHWTRQCLRDRAYRLGLWGWRQSLPYFTWAAAPDFAYTLLVALRSPFRSARNQRSHFSADRE